MNRKSKTVIKVSLIIMKEILTDVDAFLNVRVPCAKSSETGDAYRKCREEKK